MGNKIVAKYRIRIENEIGSAALIADGYHARTDGFTSLAVLFGALGIWIGFPLADPVIGLLITVAILRIVWEAGKSVFSRMLDGVDPGIVDDIRQVASQVKDVKDITEVRVRWLGHRLYAEVNIAVDSGLYVKEGHEIAVNVRHNLLHGLDYLSNAVVHVDPLGASGEIFHRLPDMTPTPFMLILTESEAFNNQNTSKFLHSDFRFLILRFWISLLRCFWLESSL